MIKRILLTLLLIAAVPPSVQAQITGLTTFSPNTRILSAEVNGNFTKLKDEALNRTGGTMTGTLTSQQITPATHNLYDLGVTGTRFRDLWLSRNATITGTLIVSGSTGHAIGITAIDSAGLFGLLGATSAGGLISSYRLDGGTLTTTFNGVSAALMSVGTDGPVIAQGANTVAEASIVRIVGSLMTETGSGTVTDAAALRIATVPTIGTTNWGIISAGNTKIGGSLFVVGHGTTFSAPNVVINAGTGETFRSLAVGFLAHNSVDDAGVASGNTIDFDTEIFDDQASFAADTFTAPVTGKYHFCVIARYLPDSADANAAMGMQLVTSNRTYILDLIKNTLQTLTVGGCTYADMDVSDTAHVILTSTDSTVAVQGSGSPYETFFSGRIVP